MNPPDRRKSMSIYSDLCIAMTDAQDKNEDFRRKAQSMASAFADALHKHIGAPKSWSLEVDGHKTDNSYVSAVPVDENGAEYKAGTPSLAAMSFTQDNFYRFKLVLVLERSPESFPKNLHMIHCGVRPEKDGSCMLFVELLGIPQHRIFHCTLLDIRNDGALLYWNYEDPSKYCVELVKAWFSLDPFEAKQ